MELFCTAKDCEREGGGGNGRKSLTFSEEKKKDMEGNISDCLILIDGSSNNSWITQMQRFRLHDYTFSLTID